MNSYDDPWLFRFACASIGQRYIWKVCIGSMQHNLLVWDAQKKEAVFCDHLKDWLDMNAPGYRVHSERRGDYVIVFSEENHALMFRMVFNGRLIEDEEEIAIAQQLSGVRTA